MKVYKRDKTGKTEIDFYKAVKEIKQEGIDIPELHLELGALILTPNGEYWMEI